MFKKVAMVLGVVAGGLIILVSTRPDTYHVERSATLAASPEQVFQLVNDFHQWEGWSPWAKYDPNMTKSYDGPAAGVGASYFWSGNSKVGEGRMTITESLPGARVVIKLEFLKPWKSVNTSIFTFSRQGASTLVTWSMDGQNNFASKAFSLFSNMDSMVGPDFERGLAQMKGLAEAAAKQAPTAVLPSPLPAVLPAPTP